jgi:micrococcal nuclease
VLAAIPVASAPAAEQGRFNLRARVTAVIDGDTLDVRLNSGRRDRIRVLGIDSPERGACYAPEPTARTRSLAGGRRIRLIGDARQATRDRFGRRLAYITLPNGTDLGRQLLSGGFAKVLVVVRPFTRHASYVASENAAKAIVAGMWTACAAPADLAVTNADAPDPVNVGAQLTCTSSPTPALARPRV